MQPIKIHSRRALMILLVFGGLAVVTLAWTWKFYPKNRLEVSGPQGFANRTFTRNAGFAEGSISLCAGDWPWTFTGPAVIGYLNTEGYPTPQVNWSNDGSILVLRIQKDGSSLPLFVGAYDFKEHRSIKCLQEISGISKNCDKQIVSLLDRRGGLGPVAPRIDDGKIFDYDDHFPLGGWIAPLGLLGAGLISFLYIKK